MGLMTMFHAERTDLVPVTHPVAVYPHMVSSVPVTLTIKEAAWSMSGDDFGIKDAATGKTVLKCKGSTISIHDRKRG